MSTTRPYEAYSATGVDWIERIPASWVMTRLKLLVEEERQITYGIVQAGPNVEGGVPYIRPADMSDEDGVNDFGGLLRTSKEIASSYRRSAIHRGDLVCSIGPSFGKVMVVPDELSGGNLTQGTARVAISAENSPRFYFWALRSTGAFQQWESSVGGATFRALNLRPLAETRLPRPPTEEQTQIAKFLDYETAKIDALIEKQQQLIALLKEKRQAVISHAVTKGLNPNAPMRDSGVEWLGEVPAHWAIARLARFIRVGSGEFLSNDEFSEFRDPESGRVVPVVGGNGVSGWASKSNSPPRTMVIGRVGALCGNVHLVSEASWVTDNALRVLSSDVFVLDYLVDLLRVRNLNDLADRSAQPLITGSRIKGQIVPVPPADEQEGIARFISERERQFSTLVEKALVSIILMQERRAALISAAVTGKIDVRSWMPPEPKLETEAA